ncbi:MAG: DUF481 domain-containing protein [Desulfomonilia bacterium]
MARKMTRGALIFFLVLVMHSPLLAQDSHWTDEAELSFVQTKGNTDLVNLSARNIFKYKFSEKIAGSWKIAALYGKTDGDKTAENYSTELRGDYLFTERFYASALAGWLRDKFSGIESRLYGGPAIGYKFLIGPVHLLSAEIGVLYAREDYTDETDDSFLEGRAMGVYEFMFTEKSRFSQSAEFLYDFGDSENYSVLSETALISEMNGYLSLKASYIVDYDHQPTPETLKETDTKLGVTLIINFR